MLTEIFGMEWYQIHDEAEHLEHAVSPAFEAKLIERLGDKGLCPHGNTVLPETPAQRAKRGHLLLSEAAEGFEYNVVSFYERDPKLLVFLHQLGFAPAVESRSSKRTTTRHSPSKPPRERRLSAKWPPKKSGSNAATPAEFACDAYR